MTHFNIPSELIIDIDQTPLPFVLISKYTMDEEGKKKIPIPGTADYRQITGTFAITLAGDFLPIQLIYAGKTHMCHAKYTFPPSFHVTHTDYHWANEETSVALLEKIIIPYVENKRQALGLGNQQEWLLISDVFKGQWTDRVKDIVSRSKGKMEPIPSNWTNYFQALDLSVNKSCKDFLRQEAQSWYSDQIVAQMKMGKLSHEIKVDTRISVIKPLHAKCVTKFYDYIRRKPDIVKMVGRNQNYQNIYQWSKRVWIHLHNLLNTFFVLGHFSIMIL